MGRSLAVAIIAFMALAGCSPDGRKHDRANVQLAANGKPVPDATPSPSVPLARMYLTSFAGRWGVRPMDCDISRGDTGGVLEIRDDTLILNGSTGRIARISAARPESIRIDVAMKEGKRRWTGRLKLSLMLGGTRLEQTGPGQGQILYTRC